jgi:hypothetical protein
MTGAGDVEDGNGQDREERRRLERVRGIANP